MEAGLLLLLCCTSAHILIGLTDSLFGRSFTVWPDSNDKESFKVMLSHKVQRRRAITDFQIDKPV